MTLSAPAVYDIDSALFALEDAQTAAEVQAVLNAIDISFEEA